MASYLQFGVLFIVIVGSHAADLYDKCVDGLGAEGICVLIQDCNPISALLQRRPALTDADKTYIKKSSCGRINSKLTACCPLPKSLKARFSAPAGLPSDKCGRDSSSRIVGGDIAEVDEFPWLAQIQYYKPNKRFGFHCGGVLINERYVLTAAHCIQNVPSSWKVYKVRLGEFDTESDVECSVNDPTDCVNSVQDILISSYYIHEDYFNENGADYNDIALIRLSVPVSYTEYISPICMPTTEELRNLATEDKLMTVAGWGQTENGTASRYKMHLSIPGWSNVRCGEAFQSANVDIIESQLCAGGKAGQDSCRGDSGGPLMKLESVQGKNSWFLKGLVSFGSNKCGTKDVPGVYTRVSHFIDWIQENIEE